MLTKSYIKSALRQLNHVATSRLELNVAYFLLPLIQHFEGENPVALDKYSKLVTVLTVFGVAVLLVVIVLMIRNNIIREQTNKALIDKNTALEEAIEKAEKASQARANFLSTVTHELRTPLNTISGLTHLLIEENPKPEQLEHLKTLKFSSDYLRNFIDDILEINRIDREEIRLNATTFSVKDFFQDVKKSGETLSKSKFNTFKLELGPNIPDYAVFDRVKLTQILYNLINNACKFTENGHVTLKISLKESDEHNFWVIFEVIDNGIGIEPEIQEQIFEAFVQGSQQINRKYGGAGMGLSIVKKLTDKIGGTISLKSTPGKGTTFTLELPFEHSTNLDSMMTTQHISDASVSLDSVLVLLVEDNKINQLITKKILETQKIVCEIAETGEAAVEMATNKTYHLILMDVHLPGISGIEATKEIRKAGIYTPIVGLTAVMLNENRGEFTEAGMDDVMTKPFEPAELFAKIASFTAKKL